MCIYFNKSANITQIIVNIQKVPLQQCFFYLFLAIMVHRYSHKCMIIKRLKKYTFSYIYAVAPNRLYLNYTILLA